nr:F-box protein CPR1-like [Quercus suber]
MSQTREPPTLRHRNNHLPYDVVLNILGQLPVKSVMRLRCVSKCLYSSITSPDFISTYLNNINNNNNMNHDNARVIHIESESTRVSNRQVCMVALARTFDRISEIGVPFDFPTKCVQIVGSCNGLLCLADYPPGNVVYLWNPSIRRFKKLPHTCLGLLKHVTLGFAYCSENNDYKVVRTSGSSLSTSEIEIGALHWMASVKEENRMTETDIMAFDVNSEKFRKLALPHGSIDGPLLQRCVPSFRGKLAFFEESGFQYSIWVMGDYGVVESWNKLFVVPFERVSCWISLTDYGSLMVWYRNDQAEGQGFEHALIDIETLQEKKDPDIQHPSYVATFMESLVLLDGTNVESY